MIDTNKKPKILVVTPTYNSGKTIERCIKSVKQQTYKNVEQVIVDAKSTDNTMHVVKKYGLAFISETDRGLFDGMCKGISRFNGDIIHILNSDDWYVSDEILEDVVNNMNSRNLELIHGRINLVNKAGKTIKTLGQDVNKKSLVKKMKVAHPSVFVRNYIYKKYGCYSECFSIAADFEWLLRVWGCVSVGFIDKELVNMEDGGVSRQNIMQSCRESVCVSILHGLNPLQAIGIYYHEIVKNHVINLIQKKKNKKGLV
ncbi:MAG: glycosyltransferase family 2 protein [Candidatus Thiodiazotropha endolucinida]